MVKKAGSWVIENHKFVSWFGLGVIAVVIWFLKVDAHMETEGHPLLMAKVEKNEEANRELKETVQSANGKIETSLQSIRQTIREMSEKLAKKLDGELIRAEFQHIRELLQKLEKQMERMADLSEAKKKNANALARRPTARSYREMRETAARNLARDSIYEN